jgi:hypothetical protein
MGAAAAITPSVSSSVPESPVLDRNLHGTAGGRLCEPVGQPVQHQLLCLGGVQRIKARLADERLRDRVNPGVVQRGEADAVHEQRLVDLHPARLGDPGQHHRVQAYVDVHRRRADVFATGSGDCGVDEARHRDAEFVADAEKQAQPCRVHVARHRDHYPVAVSSDGRPDLLELPARKVSGRQVTKPLIGERFYSEFGPEAVLDMPRPHASVPESSITGRQPLVVEHCIAGFPVQQTAVTESCDAGVVEVESNQAHGSAQPCLARMCRISFSSQ